MKKTPQFIAALAAGLVALLPLSGVAADIKIGTVNLEEVFRGYYETKQTQVVMSQRVSDYKKAMGQKEEEMNKLQKDIMELEAKVAEPATSEAKKNDFRKESQTKQNELRQLVQKAREFMQQEEGYLSATQERRRGEIMTKIRKVVEQLSREQGFNFVFDVAGISASVGQPVIIYSDGRNDITQDVLAILNRDAPPIPPAVNKP